MVRFSSLKIGDSYPNYVWHQPLQYGGAGVGDSGCDGWKASSNGFLWDRALFFEFFALLASLRGLGFGHFLDQSIGRNCAASLSYASIRAHGVVVSRPPRMWKALGSHPSVSTCCRWRAHMLPMPTPTMIGQEQEEKNIYR